MAAQQDSNPVGRPLKFKTVDDLDAAIEQYFGEQGPHIAKHKVRMLKDDGSAFWATEEYMTEQQPLTVSGLARALGIDRDTLINYKKRDEFFGSIQAAYDRVHEYAERQLFSRNATGAQFSLKNNWGWQDKQVLAGDPEAPLSSPIAALTETELRRLAASAPEPPTDGASD